MKLERVQVVVRGRVQRVGFRLFMQQHAADLGLAGYCYNQEDGTVFGIASGQQGQLRRWLDLVKRGPDMAYVSGVSEEWNPPDSSTLPSRFEVRG